ncbi:bifunctional helix-turn-helix transcriptional regulator/GNAT family N-acetyltransferase [Lactiplantibacillus sp. WILCCON 0030]|uniref:Bifunctional helix-turn-helix transcriptional regulator/GNAT family N-acetyltransferase n=1 Tax=Lactiplantibacillus brownii TaxID=3069269 RepID=A0ABU1A961_9LACO|nr:bifunctional helix-turn-helix transcriptional regulator/GNAT family N-acetyltransferase [Lactiplantibacillus brownii]MDQ7937396.1 bifunctional helix-turn-helix transcriptional regulator/GNAT family N-acetyltransferase [Lactiplantibacillus brownii]
MTPNHFITKFRSFNRYYSNLLSGFDRHLYGDPFSLVEDRVVTTIKTAGVINPNDISEKLNLNKSQLSKILTKMEKQDIIQRSINPKDKRSILISLTTLGEQLQDKQVRTVQSGLNDFVSPYSPQQLGRMSKSMQIIKNTLTNEHNVKIETTGLSDIGYIADLHARVYTARHYHAIFQYYVLESLAKYTQSELGGVTFTATVDGTRAGTVSLVESTDGTWQVRWFVVDPAYQGHGLGKQLITTLVDYAKLHDISQMYLWTVSELEAARSIYARNGFHRAETKPNHEWKDNTIMEERWDYTPGTGRQYNS